MPIFEATVNCLTAIPATTFAALGIKERADLQRLLAIQIEALEQGLLVLTDEFSGWANSARRIDLLCLDRDANLVVIELKRDEDGGHMELQALRYAAMVSAMTLDQAAVTLARFRNKLGLDEAAARAEILAHLGWTEPDEGGFAQETRIILAAADFGKEITTTVLWLRDRFGLDIRCVRLRPHRIADGRLLLDIQQLIPLPEAAQFQTQLVAKQVAVHAQRHDLRYRFWVSLLDVARPRTKLHATRSPSDDSWMGGSIGRTGLGLNYVIRQHDGQVELKIDSSVSAGPAIFLALKSEREDIEKKFGGPLQWEEPPAIGGWRICHRTEGGYRDSEAEWYEIQSRMVDAMIRLDAAIRLRVTSASALGS